MASTPPSLDSNDQDSPPRRPSFLAELRRRKVFRVAITYAVVAWLIIQVAAVTFADFGIPVWAFRFVVLMVILGFPLALVITWAFELTPEGVVKSSVARKQVAGSDPDASALNRKRNWLAIAFAAGLPTLIFGSLALFFYLTRASDTKAITQQALQEVDPQRPYIIGTVAMLPITVIGGSDELRSTAEGLHDEFLTTMSEMGPLNVVSRTSSLKFEDSKLGIPEIGESLDADYIVEGSIQMVGSRIRVTLQLIEAGNDQHIWADTFDHSVQDIEDPLRFQKEYAYEMGIRIYQALEAAHPPTGPVGEVLDQEIDSLWQHIWQLHNQYWNESDSDEKLILYDQILKKSRELLYLKPDYIPAHDEIAVMLPEAHFLLGLESIYDEDWKSVVYLNLKRAVTLNPDGYFQNYSLGEYYLNFLNDPHKAIPCFRKALEAHELYMATQGGEDIHWPYTELARVLLMAGQTEAAITILEQGPPMTDEVQYGVAWEAYHRVREPEKLLQIFSNDEGGYPAAILETVWTGNLEYIQAFQGSTSSDEDLSNALLTWWRRDSAYLRRDYKTFARLLSSASIGDHFTQLSYLDAAFSRGWIQYVLGNTDLAKSYFRGFLDELDASPRGMWMQKYQPEIYAASKAHILAYLGDRKAALEWVHKAENTANPGRHFSDYFSCLMILVETHAQLGMPGEACQLIDQILSSNSVQITGQFMVLPRLDSLHESAEFEAVIRKHAHQLRDPAYLEEYFGKKDNSAL